MFHDTDITIDYGSFNEADRRLRFNHNAAYCRITEEETVWYGTANPADNHSIGPVIAWHNNKGQTV